MSEEKKATDRVPVTRRARRSVIILVILAVLLAGTSMGFTVVYVHQFCSVITAVTAVPPPKPANPEATPAQASQYGLYQRFVRLGSGLHC